MSILESNAARLRNLSAAELYLYIVAHGLLGIGLGAFAARPLETLGHEVD